MSRSFHYPLSGSLSLFVAISLVVSIPAKPLTAQLSEFDSTRFVAEDTYLAISINWRAMLERIDSDDPLVRKLLDSAEEDGGLPFGQLERIILMVSSRIDETSEFSPPPVANLLQFGDAIDSEAILRKAQENFGDSIQLSPEDYKGQLIHVGKTVDQDGVMFGGVMPAYFFPAENTLVQTDESMARQMIDGEANPGAAMELVNGLDSAAVLNLVLEEGSNLTAMPWFGMMVSPVPGVAGMDVRELVESVARLEIVASINDATPIRITLEATSEAKAEKLLKAIKTVLADAPAWLDNVLGMIAVDEARHDNELMAKGFQANRDLIGFFRTAVEKAEVARDGATIRLTVNDLERTDRIPTLIAQSLGMQMLQMEELMSQFSDDLDMPMGAIEAGEVIEEGIDDDKKSDKK